MFFKSIKMLQNSWQIIIISLIKTGHLLLISYYYF